MEQQKTTPNIAQKRYETCKSCEHFTTLNRCKLCGCFMQVKVHFKSAKCPANKW